MTTELAPGPPVPPEYIGVWKRTLLHTPKSDDTTTQVYWLQTQSWHADIRVPASRPAFTGKTGLDQLNRAELLELAKQQGFCGVTHVDGDICRWLRQYDFQPPSGASDIGRMVFDGADRVFEYGVEADYFEIWERMPGSRGRKFALQLSANPLSMMLVTGCFFMLVRPRATTLPMAPNLAAFAADKSMADLQTLPDFEISFGKCGNDGGNWAIGLSTLPWRQGKRIQPPASRPEKVLRSTTSP
jgi:hypothetical protein